MATAYDIFSKIVISWTEKILHISGVDIRGGE